MSESANGQNSDRALALLEEIQRQQLATTERLDLLAGDIDVVKEQGSGPRSMPAPDDSEERLTQVERAVKWASPWRNLLVLIGFFVVGGVAVITTMRDLARDAVIETVSEAHGGEDPQVEPSVKTVGGIQSDVADVKGGVDCLVAEQKREQRIKEIEMELDLHRQEHEQLLRSWSANKAARRRAGKMPTKTPRHLELEAALTGLAAQTNKLCDSQGAEP